MKRKLSTHSSFFSPRALLVTLLCAATACFVLIPMRSGLAFLHAPSDPSQRTLTFEERVSYQRTIEEVYWRHRIWPKERSDPKPSLDAVMSQAQLEKKVKDYLRNSQALEDHWQRPITSQQLQVEMDRMAQHTRQPEVLQELFEALGNDPFVIAECLARPVLAERLLTNSYAYDQRFHGDLKRCAKANLQAHNSIEQMEQLSGKYSSIEFVKSENSQEVANRDADHAVKLDSREWDQNVHRLVATFNKSSGAEDYESVPIGKLSPLQEDENRYYATAVIEKGKDRLRVATVTWQKQPLRSWLATVEDQVPATMAAASVKYTLPNTSDGATCTDNTWTATSDVPVSGPLHTAVWTGSEMIVWGGFQNGNGALLNTGGRYNPSTDSWVATSTTNAPTARVEHTAVWSGTEMIVWGGYDDIVLGLNTGGRYNPSTDSWVATSTTNVPTARRFHTAVWTGNEMIVFGGDDENDRDSNTGGRYNPSTDAWTATSIVNAAGRSFHTAIWSGSEMIVWGGEDADGFPSNTGGRYNPSTDSWTVTSMTNVPPGRALHTAVWTGSEMIVWGGDSMNTGGRYNPSTDSWMATTTVNAPEGRTRHTAVWTGSEMVIWGGHTTAFLNTGGRYNPSTDNWTATSLINVPGENSGFTAVWTGTEMIVWDGSTGGRYNPGMDSWVGTGNPPTARSGHSAVWTGTEMIVWGGKDDFFNVTSTTNTGARYDPSTDSWAATSTTNAPDGREFHTAVWTGSEMIVWGGVGIVNTSNILFNTGGRYNPASDSWVATSTTNAPTARVDHTAVWTGNEMIVWGGEDENVLGLNTGGRYNPTTDSWLATSTTNVPTARNFHTSVWTGSEMIVWGGDDENGDELNTGGRYNPDSDVWTAISTTGAPEARETQTAVWTGKQMIVWGGQDSFNDFNTGGRYDPSTDTWTPTSITNVPEARYNHTAVWTGKQMIVWGGISGLGGVTNTGGRYDPNMDTWAATSITHAPVARQFHTAVWTGNEMTVWGGDNLNFPPLNSGGRYCGPTPPPGCTVTSTTCGRIIVGTAPTDFTVNLSDPADPATVQASDFTVNGTPADNDIIINGDLSVTFHFNTSPVVGGQNTMHIPAGAFNCGQGAVQEFTCTFFYRVPGATPPPRPRPTPHPRPTPP